MFRRAFTTLLAITVIGCPYLCSSGAMSCCAPKSARSLRAHQETRAYCEHCCPHEEGESPTEEAPKSRNCQGVCGGALVEKPVQFRASSSDCLAPAIPGVVAVLAQRDVSFDEADGRGNRPAGRALRAEFCSFLC